MKKGRLPFQPSSGAFAVVESCLGELRPEGAELAAWHDAYVANQKARIALDLDIVRQYAPPGARVLDVGAAPLLLTRALQKSGFDVAACDIAPERYATTIGRLGLDVARCDVDRERIPFPDNSFDAVVFNEIFEHLRVDLIFTMSEVLRVLRPGAPLMLSTPNLRSLKGIANFLLRNKSYSCSGDVYTEYKKLRRLGHMGHVREYTTREVTDFLGKVGFVVERILYRGQYRDPLGQALIRARPGLSPFVSYVAVKPAGKS
jgi:SAM-dependent methyltransferase